MLKVELRKVYEFLGMMAACMESQLQFFEKGYAVLKEMEPLIRTSREMVENRKQKMATKRVRLHLSLLPMLQGNNTVRWLHWSLKKMAQPCAVLRF